MPLAATTHMFKSWVCILEDSVLCAVVVETISPQFLAFVIVREFPVEKNDISAVNVGNLLNTAPASFCIGEFTQEQDCMSVVNVGNLLARTIASFNTINSILEEGFKSASSRRKPSAYSPL